MPSFRNCLRSPLKAAFLPVFKAIVLGFLLLQGNTITKKASWGGKGYLLYTSIFNSAIGESQGRDLEASADADRGQGKGCCELVCSSRLAQAAML